MHDSSRICTEGDVPRRACQFAEGANAKSIKIPPDGSNCPTKPRARPHCDPKSLALSLTTVCFKVFQDVLHLESCIMHSFRDATGTNKKNGKGRKAWAD